MAGLDTLAEKVDLVAAGDKDIVILSGFEPTKDTLSDAVKPGSVEQRLREE